MFPVLAAHPGVSAAATRARTGEASPLPAGPKKFYLALGDSLAFGYQPRATWPYFDITHGYARFFYQYLKTKGTQYGINMGCAGESTTTFINGGCPVPLHHVLYKGPQLAAALTFLANHRGQVSPVTIDIGADDVLPLLNASTCAITATQAQITAVEQTFDANFTSILQQLQQAIGTDSVTGKPLGDLITMSYYNPYQNYCAQRNPLVAQFFAEFNRHIVTDAASLSVPVVDVFSAFGGAATPNPHITGSATTCPSYGAPASDAYTWMCWPIRPSNIHPTTLGYQQIATAFEATAGYQ